MTMTHLSDECIVTVCVFHASLHVLLFQTNALGSSLHSWTWQFVEYVNAVESDPTTDEVALSMHVWITHFFLLNACASSVSLIVLLRSSLTANAALRTVFVCQYVCALFQQTTMYSVPNKVKLCVSAVDRKITSVPALHSSMFKSF